MDYNDYGLEDFLFDDYFRQWVNGNLPTEDKFWETWQLRHPDKKDTVKQAILILKSLTMQHREISGVAVSRQIQQIIKLTEEKPLAGKGFVQMHWIKIAAAAIIIIGCGWLFRKMTSHTDSPYNQRVQRQKKSLIEKINTEGHPVKVDLEDGSVIVLEPNSRVSYPERFADNKREVYLEGEGFFTVSKNPNRPFIAYANGLITKVLGTSFSIKAYEKGQEVVVKVFSGKVSVLSDEEKQNGTGKSFNQATGVILTANQMMIFDRKEERLTKTLVENPQVISSPKAEKFSFNFINTPVAEVFDTLEKAFGVEIVYEEELLKQCQVTAPLGTESLYKKLELICKVIRASYEVVDGKIIVTGKGCNN